MKASPLLSILLLFATCTPGEQRLPAGASAADSVAAASPAAGTSSAPHTAAASAVSAPTYSNARFRNVQAEPLGGNKFRITGQAQVFEASFSWVIEDGHNELKQGHEMTDAGAPEWGNFSFVAEAEKARENSTLHLILFEASAEDGSRQHELPLKLF